MIKANELIMGSLLDTPEGIRATVAAQLQNGAVDFDNGSRYDSRLCHAIPLTLQWIETLGFDHVGQTGDGTATLLFGHGMTITLTVETKYVHQLQYLYFNAAGAYIPLNLNQLNDLK